jgi:hypothetical protein
MSRVTQFFAPAQGVMADAAARMHITPTRLLVTGAVLSLLFGAVGVWCLFRVRRLLKVLVAFEERLRSLTTSVSLLTDTTESCFKALSMQLQFVQAQNLARSARRSDSRGESGRLVRQSRMAAAARQGETLASVAASEQIAEGEAALRLHMLRERQEASREQPKRDVSDHGPLHF